jgi:hypothetical protein
MKPSRWNAAHHDLGSTLANGCGAGLGAEVSPQTFERHQHRSITRRVRRFSPQSSGAGSQSGGRCLTLTQTQPLLRSDHQTRNEGWERDLGVPEPSEPTFTEPA